MVFRVYDNGHFDWCEPVKSHFDLAVVMICISLIFCNIDILTFFKGSGSGSGSG